MVGELLILLGKPIEISPKDLNKMIKDTSSWMP
jgi:hypothetical protein